MRTGSWHTKRFQEFTVKKQSCSSVTSTCKKTLMVPRPLDTANPERTKLTVAPNPKLKNGRRKKLDFNKLDWPRYISEEKLLEAIPAVYGCDPRDEEAYKALEHPPEESAKKGLADRLRNGDVVMQDS